MKSKQLNFFVISSDFSRINDFVGKFGALIINNNVSTPDIGNSYLDRIEESKSSQVYLSRETFLASIYWKYLESKNYYYIDDFKSEAIQFSFRPFYDISKGIGRARLYFDTAYYNETGKLIQKTPDFIHWATDLLNEFKGSLLLSKPIASDIYVSENCHNWITQNGARLSADGTRLEVL